MGPKEHIERELEDSGISHPSEWRKATELESEEEKAVDKRSFEKLLTYLEGEKKASDKEKIKQFSETEDSIERLELLRTMSLSDAITCIQKYGYTEGSYKYLADRLEFYQDLAEGKATRKSREQEWDEKRQKYVEVVKEYPIDAYSVSPDTIRLGVLRDLFYSAMHGTPELAAVKIATKRINESKTEDSQKIKSVVTLFGYYSGIHEGSIGQWADLGDLYKKCLAQIQRKHEGEELDDKQIEHKAVLLMAKRLEDAYNYYGDTINTSASSYNPGFKEAVAAGQLGYRVMRQMRGMRLKIQDTNLEHIERFIGKSGNNRYEREKKRLDDDVKALKDYMSDNKGDGAWYWRIPKEDGTEEKIYGKEAAVLMTQVKNEESLERATAWYEREAERLNHKFEKQKSELENTELLEEEKALQLQAITERHKTALAKLHAEYEAESTRLRERTPEQLLADLEARQTVVNERFEKRKSLAQKALDLHFRINHTGDYDSKPLAGIVDWINYAPFGTIKRAHKMMRLGASDEQIVEYALADIIAGKRGATREDLKAVRGLVAKVKDQDLEARQKWEARQKLEAMMKVGSILSISGYEASLDEVAALAGKSFYDMTEALKMYNLEQVKQFMDQGVNLQSITAVRKTTQKFGHDLPPVEVAEIASHNIDGLEDALRLFELDDVRTLLKQDVHLPTAIVVLKNTRQFGYELKIGQIASVAKNVRDIEDFTSALRGLPLAEIEKLFTVGVLYREFSKVKAALEKHGHASDFTTTLEVAQKLIKHNEYDVLNRALDAYSLEEVDQIVKNGAALGSVLAVRKAFEEKGVASDLQETIQFARYASDYNQGYYTKHAIDTFGIENARKIIAKSCRLDRAIKVHDYISGNGGHYISGNGDRRRDGEEISESLRESLKRGGIDVVIAIAKAGDIEVAVKTIEAGFTVDEITRFPFLISPLVAKK